MKTLYQEDPQIHKFIRLEKVRQHKVLNMIPSENYTSAAVMEACGSVLQNKYSEGYPKKRYYQGQANTDEVEQLAIERAKQLFGAEHVNVQPYSGSPANAAIYFGLLKPGDKIMGMRLDMGGHLTHGHAVNFSARFYQSVPYDVDEKTHLLDYEKIYALAKKEKPKIIISGYTAYPRTIDFKRFHEIAEEVGAYSMADISHIAGLIVAGAHPSPFPFTDVVMTTTHKTLRGPRGAMIMCKKVDRLANVDGLNASGLYEKHVAVKDMAGKIDKAVFPGLQGGPHENIIAGKAVAFKEALTPEFKEYGHQIVKNAKVLSETLMNNGIKLVTNGTDNHLLLIDLRTLGPGLGKQAAAALEEAGICLNANTVPYDPSPPFKPSGIRLGTPILTTRGMKEPEMQLVGDWISDVLKDMNNVELKNRIRCEVKVLCDKYPFY